MIHKLGSWPSWIKIIRPWFEKTFFSPHVNISDGCDTHISNVAQYNIDSGGGEVSLDGIYQNQGWLRVWKSLQRDNHLCRRQRTIVTAISTSCPRMKSSFHHWQCHLMLGIFPKAPIIWCIKPQTFLFQLHFRPIWSDSYKCVGCFNICIQYKIMDKMSYWHTGSFPSYGFCTKDNLRHY